MKTIRVDFSKCENSEQMHEQLRRALNLPEYYGGNLDALWDCLSGGLELPAQIEVLPAPAFLAGEQAGILRVFDEAGPLGLTWREVRDLQENVVPATGQNKKPVFVHPDSGTRILFAGNSITKHAPKPQIGWEKDCGMAASCLENDYVHLFMKRFREEIDPHAAFCIAQVAPFEHDFFTMQPGELFQEAADFDADLVLMFFGANVDKAYDTAENPPVRFGEACERLRDFFTPTGRARVFYSEGFYIRPVLDEEKRQAALHRGDGFISIRDIREREDTHGLFNHPNDLGMRLLADRFFEEMTGERNTFERRPGTLGRPPF